MSREYLVTWQIEVTADDAEGAAEAARMAQLDPDTLAVHFLVQDSDGQETKVEVTGK